MSHFVFGYRLPKVLSKPLFGDREKWGLVPVTNDTDWNEYWKINFSFYEESQKGTIGKIVNNSGYRVIQDIPLGGLKILEIGPGNIDHLQFWNEKPEMYTVVDIQEGMLERARKTLNKNDIRFDEIKIDRNQNKLPFDDNSFDLIMSFYSLEHIYPLDKYLEELNRVLRKNGRLIGAIPAEGGLAWGMGRYLTSRRWFLKNTTINPDKIICWQHPNFADHILSSLDEKFEKIKLAYWPMRVPIVDINLVVKFIYKKK